ncbi:protein kinase domain-containing protein [Nodosilinea sp. AN01ver1]|uniref:protein kinase domain-containing protein n=1 Tax=Nodosilinea sp. AN01ver1 TaxID=3423362 RepID=UPI003D3207BC
MQDSTRKYSIFNKGYFTSALSSRILLENSSPYRSIAGYEVLDEIGGGTSSLFIAKRKDGDINKDSPLCVLKTFEIDNHVRSDKRRRIAQEGEILTRFRMPHIIKIEEIIKDVDFSQPHNLKDNIIIKLPYCSGGSLRKRIQAERLDLEEAIFHLFSILIPLEQLHEKGLIHQDLKPENILFRDARNMLDANSIVQWKTILADFGLAKYQQLSKAYNGFSGTLMYASPEQILGRSLTSAADIWAWGLIAFELITGRHFYGDIKEIIAFQGQDDLVELIRLKVQNIEWNGVWDQCKWLINIVSNCLSLDPAKRPTAREIIAFLNHRISFEFQGCMFGKALDDPRLIYDTRLADCWLLLTDLEHRYKWEQEGKVLIMKADLGWADKYNRARDLIDINKRAALEVITSIIGSPENKESTLRQLEENPNSSQYQCCLPQLRDERSREFLPAQKAIPKSAVIELLDMHLICLVDLILRHNLPTDIKEISFIANICSTTNILKECQHISRLSQAYLLIGDLQKAHSYIEIAYRKAKTRFEVELCGQTAYAIFMAGRSYDKALAFCNSHIGVIQKEFPNQFNESEVRDWTIKIATALFEGKNYSETVDFLKNNLDKDVRIFTYFSAVYHVERRVDEKLWAYFKPSLFAMNQISYPALRAGIEYAWIHGEHDFCSRRAKAALGEPSIDLPMNRYYKEIFESFAEGQYPSSLLPT